MLIILEPIFIDPSNVLSKSFWKGIANVPLVKVYWSRLQIIRTKVRVNSPTFMMSMAYSIMTCNTAFHKIALPDTNLHGEFAYFHLLNPGGDKFSDDYYYFYHLQLSQYIQMQPPVFNSFRPAV